MKISLNKPASGYNLAAINDNFTKLETEFQTKVLYRNNPSGEPNTMETDLDMNGHAIYNLSELQVGGVNISEINSALMWRGTWSSATTYAVSDAVYYNGSSYIAVAANTNSPPPSASWNVLAAQGASGAGTGDVVGPASSTLNNIALYASGTGKLIKDSGVTLALGGAVESFLESSTAAAARTAIGAGATGDSVFTAATAASARSTIGAADATATVNLTGAQTVAGVKTFSSMPVLPTQSMVRLNTINGFGSTNTKIRRFLNTVTNQGTDITYADSATLGASFTINTSGVYGISYSDQFTLSDQYGVSLNSASLTTNFNTIAASEQVCSTTSAGSAVGCAAATVYLPAGSVLRPHSAGTGPGLTTAAFTITRVS